MTAAAYTEADEIEELELLEGDAPALGLRDFIRKQSPHLLPGDHLAPIIAKLEEATRHPIRLCISIPPRHGKTVTISHALAWWMQWSPADTHAYASYSDRQAWSKSRQIRNLAMQAGVEIGDADSLAEWRTEQGGGLLAAGAGSGLTGQGVNGMLIVDDPFKNRREANSKLLRDNVGEWFNEVVMTRLEEVESSASVIVIHTRWHEDDLIGRLAKSGEFEVINLTALAEEDDLLGRAMGEALWPDKYNRDFLERRRKTMGAYGFDALYQGRPRPKGSRLFGAPHYYDPAQINWTGCRTGIGADPAASEEDSACYSAAVAGRFRGAAEDTRILYLTDVYHEQVTVPQFCDDLRGFQERNDGAMAAVEGPGPGRAVMDTIWRVDREARIVSSPAKGDKFQRAQGVAAAWNDGRVLVPLGNPPWLEPFLAELETWTGVNDAYSDQVDALAHLWNSGPEVSIFDVVG